VKPVALLLLAASVLLARAPFAPADLWLLRTASDPRIRADARLVVYVETRRDQAAAAEYSNLWFAPSDGKEPHPFTQGAWRDSSPRWSPDGARIAWLSTRAGQTRIHVRGVDTAAETELPSAGETPLAFAWSAEGDSIAYTASAPSAAAPPWAPPQILPYLDRPAPTRSVFVVPVSSGTPRRISGDVPGCTGEPAWLLDSKSLLAACDAGIYLFPLAGGAPRLLTRDPGRYQSPVLSPDGARVAYLFTPRKPQSYTVRKLYVMNVDGSRGKILSGSLDRDASHPQWSSESRTVYFIADDRGATHVYAARNDGTVRQVTRQPDRLRGFSLADNGRAVSVRSTGEVFTFTVDIVTQPVTLAAPNQHLLGGRELGAVEELTFPSAGYTVQAWLVKPPSFDPARKYPLLVDVADDPRRMYSPDFNARAQILAAAGFVVLCANPRGTPGYGEEFGNLLRTRYPGDDFDDLMRGVEAVIARGFIDPQRLHIAGSLVAAWAVGHTSRFHSAIARRPIVDWTADVALSPDGPRRAAGWMGAMPWDDPDQYVKHSPLYSAANFKTPVLILAASHDPESDEFAFALRQRKVDTAVARIPDGPAAPILELQAMLAWLMR
jgi:dipeptidyl aminopeptidase/acylaminoacyl peptidase